jgi:hypothetical protein
MVRTVIGGLVGGLILFALGYLFWQTPLSDLAYKHVGDNENAAVQLSLSANLSRTGTGTYRVPDFRSAEGAVRYGNGPVATVDFNTAGFSTRSNAALIPALVVALVSGLLLAFGLAAVGGGGRGFAGVARLVVLFSLGFSAWVFLVTPITNHFGWGFWIYGFVAESVSLIVAGLVIARWFLPPAYAHVHAPAEAPAPPAEPREG